MNIAMIVAGGSGVRLGSETPKQFLEVGGKPIISWTIEAFSKHEEIDEIIIVCKDEFVNQIKNMIEKISVRKNVRFAMSGETRQQSVKNGLQIIEEEDAIVVIHDAVRPLVSERIISENIIVAKKYGAADTVIAATDTIIKSVSGEFIDEPLNRNEIYHGQTPQSFQLKIIKQAHEQEKISVTDDCQLVLKMGRKVALVTGEWINFKITCKEDLLMFEKFVQ